MANSIDWGKAHENNSIDFGAASDAANNFGSVYGSSESGETILGGGGTPSYDYLLDTYGGAAAAYSVRALSSSYTGALIKVRRSTDNQEKDFLPDANNEISLNSESVVGSQTLGNFVGSGDGFVATWYDQSGQSNDATQAIASAQPQIISAGSFITQFGKPAIQSNGSTTELEFNSFSTNGFYMAAIGQNTTYGSIISGGDDVDNRFDFGPRVANSYRLLTKNAGGGATLESGIDVLGSYLFSVIKDSGLNGEIFLNGASQGSNTNTRDLLAYTNTNRLFSRFTVSQYSDYIAGLWNEVVIYPTDQNSNRIGIEANTNNFYNIF